MKSEAMIDEEFINKCKVVIREYCNHNNPLKMFRPITTDDVRVIRITRSFVNIRALLDTTMPDDTYYELTYDFGVNKIFVDLYKKSGDRVIIDYLAINGDS